MNVSCFNVSCGKEVWDNKGLYQSGFVLAGLQVLEFTAVGWGSWLNSRGHISLAVRLCSYHTEKSGWIACCSLLRFLMEFQRVWGRSAPQQGRAGLQQPSISAKGAQQGCWSMEGWAIFRGTGEITALEINSVWRKIWILSECCMGSKS